MSSAKIDPDLLLELERTEDDCPVQAVVRLRPQEASPSCPMAEQTEATVHEVVDRVVKLVGEHESALNIFRNLGSFMIAAHPRFLRELMTQPEVAAVASNKQTESGMIEPVRKRPASLDDVRTVPSSAKRDAPSRSASPRKARRTRKKP